MHTSRMMVKASPYVPARPTLGWAQLGSRTRPLSWHPFTAERVCWTELGRGALRLAARVLGLEGAEVLVPAYHHGVEVDALLAAGTSPAFYEVGARWAVDLDDLERRVSPRTRGILLTHFAGFPGPASQLRALADRYGLVLIEDCAQALLSSDGGVPLGTTGDASVFSLRTSLPVPHGGGLVFNGRRGYQLPALERPAPGATLRSILARLSHPRKLRSPARAGLVGDFRRRLGRRFGIARARGAPGSRPDEEPALGASPLMSRIARAHDLAGVAECRRRNFFHLLGALRGVAPPLVSELPPGVCPLFYPLWVADRDEALARLRAENVEAGEGWPAFHHRCDGIEFPEATRLRHHVIALPCHQDLGPAQVAHAARAALRAVRRDRTWRSRAAGG